MNYRTDIQVLRGISVLFVVAFHLNFAFFTNGFLGVDIFFVISGFLMNVLYDPDNKKDFYLRRAKRLLPAYFTLIFFVLFVCIFILKPTEYKQIATQSLFATPFISNIGFWLQNSYFSKTEFNPLLHLWSLGVEIQFYTLLPLIFIFIQKFKKSLYFFIIISICLCFAMLSISPKTSFFMMPLRLWEFLIGYYVAAHICSHGIAKKTSYAPFLSSLGLLLIFIIPLLPVNGKATNIFYGHPGLSSLLVTISTALVLSFDLPNFLQNNIIFKMLEKLGKVSYSLYLIHFPVVVLYLYQPFQGTVLKTNNVIDKIILCILIVGFTFLLYHFVETKFRYKTFKFKTLIFIPVGMSGLIFTGYIIQGQHFTPEELKIFAAFEDRDTYRCAKIQRILSPHSKSCNISPKGKENKYSILLVGNSYADSIKKTFAQIASNNGYDTRFIVENTPLMQSSTSLSIRDILSEADKYQIRHIILHYSPSILTEETYNRFLLLAQNAGKSVYFIMPPPSWPQNIPQALYHHISKNQPLPKQSLKEYQTKNNETYRMIAKKQASHIKTYESAPYFCTPHCKIINEQGQPLYFDQGHLTLSGAQILSDLFQELLDDISSQESKISF